ncbi:MAG: DMT family transporter [Pseudomonadota bacterium]
MLLFSALIAGSFSLGALVANDIAPAAFNAVRFGLAALFVGALVLWQRASYRALVTAAWRYLILGGLFGFYFVMMFEGLKTAPPVSTSAVFTLVPLMSAGVAGVLLQQLLTKQMGLALSIGACGALWVIFRGDLTAVRAFDIGRGEAVFLIGCISHAIYTPMVKWLNRGESAVISTLGTVLGGCLVLGLYALPDLVKVSWTDLPPRVWLTLLYTSFFATAVTVVLLQFAALRLPSANVMAYTYLTPSWVILWELALGNGAPPTVILWGLALTLLALLLLLREGGVALISR